MTNFFAGTVPQWPEGLKDETPLPFTAWRVLNWVDGKRSIREIAAQVGLSTEQVATEMESALDWAARMHQQSKVITEEVIDTVTQTLMSVVGPMGEFIVDDVLDEVGNSATLSQLLAGIAPELDEQHLQTFARLLHSKGLA